MENELAASSAGVGQRLLWLFERRLGARGALNVPVVVRLRGGLDKGAAERAVIALVARHEALRTRMAWRRPTLMRLVAPSWRPEIKMVDLSTEADPIATFERDIRVELTTPIDSAEWPLRVTIWTMAPDDHVMCLNLNHMATDSISNGVILNELANLYRVERGEALPALPETGWQYSRWIDWQTSQLAGVRRARLEEYWTKQLTGADGPRFSASPVAGSTQRLTGQECSPMGAAVFEKIALLANEERATLFSVLLAIFYTALCRQTGQTDLTVMTMLSDRNRPQVLSTVGYFVSAVALRTAFALSDSFVELVRACRATFLGAIQHQTMPFHMLPPAVTRKTTVRIDDVVLQLMGDPVDLPEPFEPWYRYADFGGGRTFDLEVVIQPVGGCWSINVLYGTHRFEEPFIRRLVADYCDVARLAVADPRLSIGDLVRTP